MWLFYYILVTFSIIALNTTQQSMKWILGNGKRKYINVANLINSLQVKDINNSPFTLYSKKEKQRLCVKSFLLYILIDLEIVNEAMIYRWILL